jgi:Family of unknown function (DUF6515)
MSHTHNKSLSLIIGLMLVVFFGFTQIANADRHGPGPGHGSSLGPGSRPGSGSFMDSRYHHDHSYPARGHYVGALPRGHYVAAYGHSRYYFHGGVWYRPYGSRFIIAAPPFGLIVPFLPLYYSTIWVGGLPYYYANEVYYTRTSGGYMVVEPPKGEVVEAPASEERLFIYPRKGQSEKQQSDDRYACHSWAVDQTNYDPTQPPGTIPEDQKSQKRSEYQRAIAACLDARGYTVK